MSSNINIPPPPPGVLIKDTGTLVGRGTKLNITGATIMVDGADASQIDIAISGGSGGTVTSVGTGNGLQGGPIIGSGTVNLRLNAAGGLSKTLGVGLNELGIAAAGVTNAMIANPAVSVLSGTNTGDVTLTAVGAAPNADGASLSGQVLTLQPADGANPGLLTSGTQTIGGDKTLTGMISALNLSGVNTGDVTLLGENYLSILGQVITANPVNLSGSNATGVLPEIHGGTNQNTYVLGDTLYASAANTLAKLSGNTTSTKKFLRQTGTGVVSAAPAWDTVTASDIPGSALTKTDDTNVTLTLGGSPATALLNAASLTLGWTGQLSIARGGTNSGTALSGSSIAVSNGTAIVQGAAGTSTTVLHGNAAGLPTYSAVSLTADVSGTLPIANGGTNSSTALSGSSVIVSNGTAVVQGPAGTTSTVLHGNASGTPTYGAVVLTTDVSGTLPIANGGTNSATALSGSSIMVSNGTSVIQGPAGTTSTVLHGNAAGTPTYGTVSLTVDVSGILPIANGGTNSNTTLNNNRIIQSLGGALVEAPAITAARALKSDANGIPVASTATAASLDALSGTNTGDVTLAAVGATPNGNAASLSGQVLTLQPADGTNPGVITAGTQTFGGAKTFNSDVTANSVRISGTAGAGFVELLTQSANPSAPASGFREFADSTGRFSWIRQSDGFVRTWDATLTANRVYTLADATGLVQLTKAFLTKSANYTITLQDFFAGQPFLVDTSGGAFSLTLPSPSTLSGYSIRVKDSTGSLSTNNLTLVRNAAEKIDNVAASKVFSTNYGGWQIYSDGTNWWIF